MRLSLVLGVPGGLELEGRVRHVEVPLEAVAEPVEHAIGLATLERTLDPVEAILDDLVGQAKVVEPLPEGSELLFLASLQLLRRFLVSPDRLRPGPREVGVV